MRDLRSGWSMWMKAGLFLVIGLVSSILILVELPDWRIALLLGLAVWSFCRAYYFAFYVIERYLDPTFRYSGLFSTARHLWLRKVDNEPATQKEIEER